MTMQTNDIRLDFSSFNDARLNKAGTKLFNRILESGSCIVKRLANDRAEQVQFERFLWNEKVTNNKMKTEFFDLTKSNLFETEHVLAIQDTTEFSLGKDASKRLRGLGTIGSQSELGLFLPSNPYY